MTARTNFSTHTDNKGVLKGGFSTSPTHISTGKHDKAVIRYLLHNNITVLNKTRIFHDLGISKGHIINIIKRLEKQGLIKYNPETRQIEVTEAGKQQGTKNNEYVRKGVLKCREDTRQHRIKFKTFISSGTPNITTLNNRLQPTSTHSYKLNQTYILNLYFEGATLVIYPNCVIINIHELYGETEDVQLQAFNQALEYLILLEKAGLFCENIQLENSHYEFIKKELAQILQPDGQNLSMDLGNGRYVWIDNSPTENNKEGEIRSVESNDSDVRDKLKQLVQDLSDSDSRFNDIDKIKEALGYVASVELKRAMPQKQPQQPQQTPSYIL